MNTCKNCKFWKQKEKKTSGECANKKFANGNDVYKCPKDGLRYWDYEGYECGFETGPNFGCIHFKG